MHDDMCGFNKLAKRELSMLALRAVVVVLVLLVLLTVLLYTRPSAPWSITPLDEIGLDSHPHAGSNNALCNVTTHGTICMPRGEDIAHSPCCVHRPRPGG